MAGERTYPLLPARDIDESIAFYESIGFTRTYRQVKPNPSAVVARDDLTIHLFGMPPAFDPADSYGSVIVVMPDPDAFYAAITAGLRAAYGKLPVTGFPRVTRPRKRYGTVRGFSLIDPGGNWIRVYKAGDTEEAANAEAEDGLAGIVAVAARLGDAKGDVAQALKTLGSGIRRLAADAAPAELVRAHLYHAELAIRTGDVALARTSLAAALAVDVPGPEAADLADEVAHVEELVRDA